MTLKVHPKSPATVSINR